MTKVFNTQEVDWTKQPMFFGAEPNTQRFDQQKYPIFEKLNQQQLGFFWRPEEVSLQKDRNDFNSLTAEQRHIFTANLKYPEGVATAEVLKAGNAAKEGEKEDNNPIFSASLYALGIIFIFTSLLPILPSGSFMSTFTSGIFWFNFALMAGYIKTKF